ncbi:hypothetical protein P691DRAFT_446655 [Macrolepiota fuliginosa MF-IS2]|uniref:Uncharacterized protein n=1 Tax=Macrolepiota fuliginosa MF-IS2 TaxID=1400762 RepID=A0A9P5XRZ5_9AGAR|nr:hypothetical protein P691DRAFT_446655 [Macrolepiota fuliginosa MF-IS2]
MKTSTARKSPRCHPDARSSRSSSKAQDERRRQLLDDPRCNLINPHLTQCRGCGVEIKLSPKMLYDTCHWVAHSGRCARPLVSGEQIESSKPLRLVGDEMKMANTDTRPQCEMLEAAHHLLLFSGRPQRN